MTDTDAEPIDPVLFRQVMSRFATGVTVVTGFDPDGEPAGMTCQSFTSLSLDPPLAMVCPAKASTSWPRIGVGGRIAINVLADHQREISAAFARSGGDKFAGVSWHPGLLGLPLIDGALAQIECELESVYPGGDHHIAVGRIVALYSSLADGDTSGPLLYYGSRYYRLDATDGGGA